MQIQNNKFSTNNSFMASKLQFKKVEATKNAIDFAKKNNIISNAKQVYSKTLKEKGEFTKIKISKFFKLESLIFNKDLIYGPSFNAYFKQIGKDKKIQKYFQYIYNMQGKLLETICYKP